MSLHRNPVVALVAGAVALSLLAGCGGSPAGRSLSSTSTVVANLDALAKPVQARTFKTLKGTVTILLPDDMQGLKHQLFRFETRSANGQTNVVQCAHNIDLAPYIPLKVGDQVEVKGVFIEEQPYDVIHWTHHDPKGGEGGYVKLNGKLYQ